MRRPGPAASPCSRGRASPRRSLAASPPRWSPPRATTRSRLASRRCSLSRPLRVYRSSDVVGVELGGAVKNVVAIAAGICDGLDLRSQCARAALITRGLAEMMRLGGRSRICVAKPWPVLPDWAIWSLLAPATSRAIALWGLAIAKGEPFAPPTDGVPVAEGAANAVAIAALAARIGVEMPIVSAVCRVLDEAAPANAMVDELLSRQLKAEF